MAWTYTNPNKSTSSETTQETTSDLTRETWNEGTIRTDGDITEVWICGKWVAAE